MASIPLETGFCPERWRHAIDIMLEKVPGIAQSNKLRINDVHLIWSRKFPLVIVNHEVVNIMSPIGSLVIFTSTLLLGFDILY
jgi:hypothetical protein